MSLKICVSWEVRTTPFRATRCGASPVILSPSNRTNPPVGLRNPVISLKRVLFPAPFGPIMLRISPRLTLKLTWSTAVSPPNRFVSACVSSTTVLSGLTARRHQGYDNDRDPQDRAGGSENPGDQLEEGALPGAVRPDSAEDLAAIDAETHMAHSGEPAEPFRERLRLQHNRPLRTDGAASGSTVPDLPEPSAGPTARWEARAWRGS